MSTRRQWQLSLVSAIAGAALLAACGGGDPAPATSRVVAFGDSLTDLGAYTPATQIPLGQAAGVAPFFGGRFTTNTHSGYTAASNSNTATIWVEWVAARLGVAITPHEVGFGPTSVKCPAAAVSPALAGSCTGYAQGGSRVTSPAGIGNPNGNGINGSSPAPMTRPLVTQVADHLTRFSGFSDSDLVFVFGGNNDMFVLLGAVGAAQLAPDAAVAAAQATAGELATLVKEQILAKGATRVAVMTLPDAAATPGFSGLDAATKGLLSQLSAAFNAALLGGLAGTPVQVIDTRALFVDLVANPAKYGLTNVTGTACDPAKIAAVTGNRVTDGSSLFCNAAPASAFTAPLPILNTIKAAVANINTWAFADGVHPTTAGHKVIADYVISQIKAFGWMPANQ